MLNLLKDSRHMRGDEGYLADLLGIRVHKHEDVDYDTKTIYGSEMVKFAVHQANDILRLEDVLLHTTHMFVCKNTALDDKKDYTYCIRDDSDEILFYGQPADNWTSTSMMFLRCTQVTFGYNVFNEKNREIMTAVGRQCCFCNGRMDISCGMHRLGSIQQAEAGSYKIILPDGTERFTLKKQSKGWFDIMAGSRANRKVGEVRKSWEQLPLPEETHIFYGLTLLPDLPLHEKHLIFGSSFLLFYQKYRNWNNKRKFQYICFGQIILLILLLGALAAFIVHFE